MRKASRMKTKVAFLFILFFLTFINFLNIIPTFAEVPSYNWSTIQIAGGQETAHAVDPSLAFDNSNEPHICYGLDEHQDNTTYPTNIFHSYREGSAWHSEELTTKPNSCAETTILFTSDDKIHITYATDYGRGVWHITNEAGVWQEQEIKDEWTGNYETLYIDSNEKLHTSYWNNNGHDDEGGNYQRQLNYRYRDQGAWQAPEGLNESGATGHIRVYGFTKPATIIVTNEAVPIPHVIAGKEDIEHGLLHYYKTTGTWEFETFGTTTGYDILDDPNDSALFDINNNLYCLAQKLSAPKYLVLAKKISGQWSYENISEIDTDDYVRASLDTDSQNKLHIAFFNGSSLYYGVKDSGIWEFQEVQVVTNPKDVTLKLDNSDIPKIVYSTENPKKVYYAEPVTAPSNNPPIVNPIPPKTVNEGDLLSFTVSANDPDDDALEYSTEPIFGENYPVGSTLGSETGTFQWVPGYHQEGYYEAMVIASDGYGGEGSAILQITVQDTVVARVNEGEFIQPVIDDPQRESSIISISSGTYTEDLVIEDNITLIGDAPYNTIIKGNLVVNGVAATIRNLTILYDGDCSASFTDSYYSEWKSMADAGITGINSNITVRNCIINPDPDFLDTLPGEDNSLKHYGKGIQIWNLYQYQDIQPQIKYTLIHNADCAIYYFSQMFGGAIYGDIKNNTFYRNRVGILLRMHKENPHIYNNIFHSCEDEVARYTYEDGDLFTQRKAILNNNLLYIYSIQGWVDEINTEFPIVGWANNIEGDPLFEDPTLWSFYLYSEDSPSIGAGEDGEDIGAYPTDTEYPIIANILPVENSFVGQANINISGFAYDDSGILSVYVGFYPAVVSGSSFLLENYALDYGLNDIDIIATDIAEKSTTEFKRTYLFRSPIGPPPQ